MHLKTLPDRASPTSTCSDPTMPTEWSLLTSLIELTDAILRADEEAAMYRTLALGLNQCFAGEHTAIAVDRGGRFEIEVFTHLDAFDRSAELVRSLERECMSYADGGNTAVRFIELSKDEPLACLPIVSGSAQVIAIALLKTKSSSAMIDREAMSLIGEHLGPALDAKSAVLRRSKATRWWRALCENVVRNKRSTFCGGLALAMIGALPLPFNVRCEAELQPVVRRHVAAPFDGILQQSLVKPGDAVGANQPLGRLDAKELTWEIAAATAERDRAAKSRSANMATGKTAAAQIDALESRRLTERLKLLENRLAHLDIVAPLAGVVVSGDMGRAEGAPVKIGQSLFEVAPLDRMVVEVLIPEAEIDRIKPGQSIELSLDAAGGNDREGIVSRVYPRAELRNGANVFVAEVELDNESGSLRPGMKGIAEVRTERRPLAWIAFHRIEEAIRRFLR